MTVEQGLAWAVPTGIAAGGFAAGSLVDRLAMAPLRRRMEGREGVAAALVRGIGGMVILWIGLAGLLLASYSLPPSTRPALLVAFNKIVFVLAGFSVTLACARVAVDLVSLYAKRYEDVLPSTTLAGNLVRLFVMAAGILVVLQSLGISIAPILTALGVGGLAVALALQSTLANLFAGFQILAAGQIHPGDYVRLSNGDEGEVVDISWRITTVQTLRDTTVVVPNTKLADELLVNFQHPDPDYSILVPVGVSYDSDLEHVEAVTLEVARSLHQDIEEGIDSFEPTLRFNAFADSSITFNVSLRARSFADQYILRHEFIKRLHQRYRVEGIEIPFPIRTVHLRSANG